MQPTVQSLQPIRQSLQRDPQTLDQLWLNYPLAWQALGWNLAQVRLWLRCLPDIQVADADGPNPTYGSTRENQGNKDDLGEILVRILESLGNKPLPLPQLMGKLPTGIIATEPMIRAAVKAHPRLVQVGPLVKLA